jgi:hypothetical protein
MSTLKKVDTLICIHCQQPIRGIPKVTSVNGENVFSCANAPDCDKSEIDWLSDQNEIWRKI